MQFKNNVTRFLDKKQVPYQTHIYDYDAGVHSALDVAASIGLPPERVYKTLVALVVDPPAGKPLLVVIPSAETLDVKRLAKATGTKKIKMASHDQAEKLTRLQTGGISPLALINQGFDVYIDSRVDTHESIAVSAGQRGANLELPVSELIKLTRARRVELATPAE